MDILNGKIPSFISFFISFLTGSNVFLLSFLSVTRPNWLLEVMTFSLADWIKAWQSVPSPRWRWSPLEIRTPSSPTKLSHLWPSQLLTRPNAYWTRYKANITFPLILLRVIPKMQPLIKSWYFMFNWIASYCKTGTSTNRKGFRQQPMREL